MWTDRARARGQDPRKRTRVSCVICIDNSSSQQDLRTRQSNQRTTVQTRLVACHRRCCIRQIAAIAERYCFTERHGKRSCRHNHRTQDSTSWRRQKVCQTSKIAPRNESPEPTSKHLIRQRERESVAICKNAEREGSKRDNSPKFGCYTMLKHRNASEKFGRKEQDIKDDERLNPHSFCQRVEIYWNIQFEAIIS